jgi:hypothetical protein
MRRKRNPEKEFGADQAQRRASSSQNRVSGSHKLCGLTKIAVSVPRQDAR